MVVKKKFIAPLVLVVLVLGSIILNLFFELNKPRIGANFVCIGFPVGKHQNQCLGFPYIYMYRDPVGNSSEQSEKEDFIAYFEINTLGTKRDFSASMYHNLSPDVFIQEDEINVVHVKKKGVTWGDFFETLPMKLTKECLTTGTNETFCNTQDKRLSFFVNGYSEPNVLEQEIKPGERLLVLYQYIRPN